MISWPAVVEGSMESDCLNFRKSGWGQISVELRANLNSISHRCHLFEAAFVWELTQETIHLPPRCLQGGREK